MVIMAAITSTLLSASPLPMACAPRIFDPLYSVGAHGLSLEDEIWWQRRVELWGEGFAWGDIMRLNKDIIRSNSTNWPAEWATQDVNAGNGVLIWLIPQAEIEANQGISDADNNPAVSL